ncbi:MAG: hypothetical protein ACYCYE_12720 [Clostridia bacterium]
MLDTSKLSAVSESPRAQIWRPGIRASSFWMTGHTLRRMSLSLVGSDYLRILSYSDGFNGLFIIN